VIWEISNEGPGGQNEENSNAWQVAMKNHIKQYEASKPKQHKIQISSGFGMSNSFTDPTLNSGDIYSPTINPGQLSNSAPGVRMGLLDTDHGNADAFESDNSKVWVWKNFMRGYNFVINGDFSSGTVNYSNYLPESTEIISAFRQVRALSERVNLVALSPVNAECSSGYCLGSLTEVIAYSDTPSISINMGARAGTFRVEVIDPGNGTILSTGTFTAGTGTTYTSAGGSGPRVFYLKKQ
jgi:hypothetical protein